MAASSGSSTLELRDAEERYRLSTNNLHFSPAKPVKSGGLHVTISKCILLIILCVIAIVAVAIIVFVAARRTDDVVSVTSLSKDLWTICEGLTLTRNECMKTEPCTRSQQSDELTPYKPVSYVTDVRLTDDVIPEHYDLELRPDFYSGNMADFRSYGHVSIRVHCQRATSRIRLHVNALNISIATVTDAADGMEKPLKQDGGVSEDKLRQFLELRLSEPLEAGHKYLINLTFSGPLKDDLDGMYVSSYKRGNDTVWLVVTQMEPTDARKAFPCFDEPAFKATFDVTLVRKRNMTSLSNTFIISSEDRGSDWIADRYATSLKMSTYLIAFMVCDFEYTEATTTNGVQFRVWARPDAVNQTGYALDIGVRIIDHFVDYFNISYPMTKMDMVAVPDFSAGAMENWGLIIYRETALLYDPRESSTRNKQRVAVVIAHELAHQWFGNIVTMDWWDDLWLNEGFASFVEYIGTDYVEPSWKMHEQFILEELQYVMDVDGLASSHPVYIPVNHPDEISQIFDIISYSKGASVIRMLNHTLGEATFRRGLTRYLNSRRFQNAKHDHLWSALDQQAKEDGVAMNVKVVMDTWLLQMGYPLITLSRNLFSPGDIQVTQTHFLLDTQQTPSSKYPSPFGYKWEVPVTYVTDVAVNSPQVVWLHKTNETIRNADTTMNWILGNVGAYGYYRVNYDIKNWAALIQQLTANHIVIPTINRAQIIDDAFNIGRSGRIDQVIGLQATKYLTRETEYLPWQAATDNLGYFDVMLQRSDIYGLYKQYILQQIRPHYTRLGWGSIVNGHLDKYMKITVLELACHYGLPTCASNATTLYRAYMATPSVNPIEADLRYIVYCTAIRHGDVAEWDFAYSKYKTSNVAAEKTRLLAALSCSRQTWILSRYLRYILDSKKIRKQDIAQVVVGVASNPIGRSLAWDFFRANWNQITERIQSGIFLLQSLTKRIADGFNTPFELQQMDNFRRSQSSLGRTSTAYEQAMEKTRLNIRWMNDNEKKIGDWLALNTAKY